MVAEPYIIYVKQRLNDYPDQRIQLGEKYTWGEIQRCLNACLLHIVNICLQKQAYSPLVGLYRTVIIDSSPYSISNIENLMWIRGAQVYHQRRMAYETARWLGASGSAIPYLYSRINAVALLAGELVFVDDEKNITGGILEYYVYPSTLTIQVQGAPDYLVKDLPDWMYWLAAELTVMTLGIRDGQGVRDASAWQLWWEKLNGAIEEALATRERSVIHAPEALL